MLGVAVCAVLAGARSLAAIGEWVSDAPGQVLAALGTRRDPWTGAWQPLAEATVRRVLARVDPDALDRAIGAWLAGQQPSSAAPRPPPAPCRPRRAVAVDGKTLRGSGHHGHPQVHLLAVMDHTSRGVLAQTGVDSKTNEITQFRPLLDRLNLTDTVVTADALHTQREHADWLVTAKHAAYLLIVKHNQPALHHQLKALPWPDIPVADHTRDRRLRRGRLPGPYRQRPTGHGQPAHLAIGILRGHGDCNIAAACAATPATPPESCPCWASQAVKPNGPHDPAAVAGRHEHLMLVGRPTARRQEPRAARAAPNSRAQVGRPKAIGSNGPVRRSRLRL